MGFDMARIRVAILGAGRIAQHMADTLVKMAADSRYADLVEPYAVAARDAGEMACIASKSLLCIACRFPWKRISSYGPVPHSRRMLSPPALTDPALAGGALLDVGVYPINFIDMIMHNAPIARVESSMQPYETGVDAHNSMTFYYQNGVMATAQSSILCHSDRMGAVWGTKGYLTCQNINNVEAIDVFDGSHAVTAHYDVPEQLTGYEYEVASAAQAMLDGRTEWDGMPHSVRSVAMRSMTWA